MAAPTLLFAASEHHRDPSGVALSGGGGKLDSTSSDVRGRPARDEGIDDGSNETKGSPPQERTSVRRGRRWSAGARRAFFSEIFEERDAARRARWTTGPGENRE